MARNLILNELHKHKQKFTLQKFYAEYPKTISCKLLVDEKLIEALPTSFVSGKINADSLCLSSLDNSRKNKFDTNINTNPRCPIISRPNHYFAPALAVKQKDMEKIRCARLIDGRVVVKKTKVNSANILVGNTNDPRAIIFSHYDSIGPGAIDNASGVAVSMKIITENPELLRDTLFVIAGNEELSYDQDCYWGHGYRVFEKEYQRLLQSCRDITVIDCVGYGKTKSYCDQHFVELGLPLKQISKYAHKTCMVSGDFNDLMPYYHSNLDTPSRIKPRHLAAAHEYLLKLIMKNKPR